MLHYPVLANIGQDIAELYSKAEVNAIGTLRQGQLFAGHFKECSPLSDACRRQFPD